MEFSRAAEIEISPWNFPHPHLQELEEDDGATAIEMEFRRKVSGLRRLPRHARAQALRAAKDERFLALKALREKRQRDRLARYLLWRQQMSPPRQPG